ncbi:shikimate dehydrogenase [Pelagibacteraceae bacterium]|nr:shikimate dehydrogenase [Pelagibacteraceae bacterium]
MIINNDTFRLVGIIGNPITQSMSPMLHNYWMNKYKINSSYVPFPLIKLSDIKFSIKAMNLVGLNITIPYKKEIINHLDSIDKKAKELKAVNTVLNKKGKLIGFNTDIEGFGRGLEKKGKWIKTNPVYIFGAGGAAEAIISFIYSAGSKDITIINRTLDNAKKIAKRYKGVKFADKVKREEFVKAGLLVNTTSLGMIGYPDLNIDLEGINKEAIIYDIVYNPIETTLIKKAQKKGLKYITGIDMFIEQARRSFEIWFNISPEIDKNLLISLKKKINKK